MAETVLIEQTSKQDEGDAYTSLYIRLSVDSETDVSLNVFKPKGITVEEGFGKPYVDCKVSFVDTLGSLVNNKLIEGDYLFKLYIGKSPEDFHTYNLKLHSYMSSNGGSGDSSNYTFELHLISDYWQVMSHDRKVQGWRNKKYSEIITEIVEECGINNYTISDTKKTQPTVIKPYWTNHEILKWLSERSYGVNGDSFFTYSAIADGMFFYCSFDDMVNGLIPEMFDFQTIEPRTLVLGGDPVAGDKNEYRRLKDFKVVSNYAPRMSKGASGVNYGYYDYENREYVQGHKKYSEGNEAQLSDWTYMSEDQETIGHFYFGHSDAGKTSDIVKQTISKQINGMLDVVTSTNGLSDIQVGEKVNIKIPVNPEYFDIVFNEYFSGNYIVSRKRTVFRLDNNSANTIFRITRQGVNGTAIDTLTKSTNGKVTG